MLKAWTVYPSRERRRQGAAKPDYSGKHGSDDEVGVLDAVDPEFAREGSASEVPPAPSRAVRAKLASDDAEIAALERRLRLKGRKPAATVLPQRGTCRPPRGFG